MPDTRPPSAAAPEQAAMPTLERRIEQYLEQHFKGIMIVSGVLVAGLAFFLMWRHFHHQHELQAAERFTSAASVEDCDLVIQKFPGSMAAGNAMLLKADFLWKQGKKESSIGVLKDFVNHFKTHSLQASAVLSLGMKQASLGDKDAAKATLESLLKNFPQSELAPAADVALGDLLWQEGKNEEAKKHWESLLQKYPGKMVMFTQAVDERLQVLGAGLPMTEVAGPPKPAPAPAAPKITPMPLPEIKMPSPLGPQGSAPVPVPPPAPGTPVKPMPPPSNGATNPAAPGAPPTPAPPTATPDKAKETVPPNSAVTPPVAVPPAPADKKNPATAPVSAPVAPPKGNP